MFIDYYELLEIAESATLEEIKIAFRKQAIKWHPDRNPDTDTTIQMQRINEAYLILKDAEARQKFDFEYQRFKSFKKEEEKQRTQYPQNQQQNNTSSKQQEDRKTEYDNYTFNDDTLKNWMNNARRQSVDLAKQTIRDFKGMVSVGFKEGIKASGNALIGQIIISVIILIIVGLSKSCNS